MLTLWRPYIFATCWKLLSINTGRCEKELVDSNILNSALTFGNMDFIWFSFKLIDILPFNTSLEFNNTRSMSEWTQVTVLQALNCKDTIWPPYNLFLYNIMPCIMNSYMMSIRKSTVAQNIFTTYALHCHTTNTLGCPEVCRHEGQFERRSINQRGLANSTWLTVSCVLE